MARPWSAREHREVRRLRFVTTTVVSLVIWTVVVLAALPVSLVLATWVTAGLTGWSRPAGFIQGCETSIECSESATFWPVWVLCLLAYVGVAILARLRASRRSRQRATDHDPRAMPA